LRASASHQETTDLSRAERSETKAYQAFRKTSWQTHKMQQNNAALDINTTQQAAPGTKTSQNHNTAQHTPGKTRATGTAQYTHSTLLKSSNRPMTAVRRRQGQQLYAWHGTSSRRPPLTTASEATQPQPPALPLEVWPRECNTDKAKQPKRDKVFQNTTHS